MSAKIKVLVAGCGFMGAAHAEAYRRINEFEIAGLVSRSRSKGEALLNKMERPVPLFERFDEAMEKVRPDAVCISTYPDSHAEYALSSIEAGADVFLEKPVAPTVEETRKVLSAAEQKGRKLVIGYILHHHPSYKNFIEAGRTLGKPLVMRMNLNQQTCGDKWRTHKSLMESVSPLVDCGVHYVDLMCKITGARPVRVNAMGARLTEEIKPDMYNYGHLQIEFEDGSAGWYESGWGPMMSRSASHVKDIIGPHGSVCLIKWKVKHGKDKGKIESIMKCHSSKLNEEGSFENKDDITDLSGEPDWEDLCENEQRFFLEAIRGRADLTENHQSAIDSLEIVLAADESIRTKKVITIE